MELQEQNMAQKAIHVADEGGLDLNGFPAVLAWLERVSSQPGYTPITRG
jgi:glutathione S-transferase